MRTNRKLLTAGDEAVLSPDSYPRLYEKAIDTLDSSLTEEEVERLFGVKREINANIRWGRVVDEALGPILHSMESVIFGGLSKLVKHPPLTSLFPAERAFLEQGDKAQLTKHYITLLLTKKLLGALKTRVNQAVDDIPVMSDEEVEGIRNLLEPEEERRPMEPQVADLIGDGEESSVCRHVRTTMRRVISDDLGAEGEDNCDALQTYCKDCRNVVRTVLVAKTRVGGKKKKKKDKPCQHRYLAWVEGQEGQVAQCCDKVGCKHQIDDPEILKTFKWESAGLEPYGDDPSRDEVITL